VRRLADLLPDDVQVFPTHGFGSFCSSAQSDATESTLAEERRGNPALTQEEDEFVEELVAGLGAYPAYYAHMAERNAEGPTEPDLSPPAPTDAVEVRRRIERGEWVVDLRTRTVYATGHVPGSLNFGLDGSFATYVGWLVRWGTPLTLLGESPEDVARAQRELTRIGIDRPAGARTGRPEDWADVPLHSFPTATFTDLAAVRHHRRVTVLDVRREEEHVAEHVTGAVNIPVHEVPSRLEDVPAGEVWVHCASGYRASIAASFLDAAGRDPVTVDDSFENASRAGLPMVSAET
jgi:rhodanese-related sulfurtransferase